MAEKPDQWITPEIPRAKNPAFDLKRRYRRTFRVCMGIAFVLHVGIGFAFPTFKASPRKVERKTIVIETLDIPETQQIHRPPPPARPAVPIATESEEVPDDVTIEATDLDFDHVSIDVPPPPTETAIIVEEEEILDYMMVEEKPKIIKRVAPEYPQVALKAGIEGTVVIKVLIDKDGSIAEATAVRGKEIFQKAALKAVYQYRFTPARQNDRPVKVYLVMPMRFRLEQ